jgi:hypothetical protein
MIPGKPFDPATGTSRRPTPEEFAHLRKWIDPDEKFINITNITELTNVNEQLEQFVELYISNIVSRVIAQLLGAYGDGFVTLEATADGYLKVNIEGGSITIGSIAAGTNTIGKVGLVAGVAEIGKLAAGTASIGKVILEAGVAEIGKLAAGTASIGKVILEAGTAEIGKLAAGTALIGKIQIEGTSRTVLKATINFNTIATHSIVAVVAGKKIKVCNIMFTVAGETNLTFQSDANAISGAMDFGGTDEPRGMVHHFGNFPLETTSGEAFKIQSNAAIQVSGYVTYFTE